jgi:His-Xaa-Ser system radical SAM maturase HxsC
MIPLVRPAAADAEAPYVARLRSAANDLGADDALLIEEDAVGTAFAGRNGVVAIDGLASSDLDGDVVLVQPLTARVERLLRAGSSHNTLLVTERCDQLCVMCSQPPKKTHVDRFDLLEQACLLATPGALIGVSGGEPTLYKDRLLSMLEHVLRERDDLQFHVLSNGQHFEDEDVARLSDPVYRRVSWGIPIYATDPDLHDLIVGKAGAFALLEASFARLTKARARVELRTVVLNGNVEALPDLARYVAARLRFVEAWSIMQLEHIGFARGRWREQFVDHRRHFAPIAAALDLAALHGVRAQLFNFPRCTVPDAYRRYAIASISDWKRKYAGACGGCRERQACSGFFEWHPDEEAELMVRPL